MSNEYPKALYCGDKECNDMVVVDGLEQEQGKREAGYVDFAELPERESRVASGSIGESTVKANPEADSLKAELLEALKAKKEIEENFVGFRNDVQAMKARIAEIQGIPMDIDPVDTVDNAEPVESLPTHYADMTSEQLREEIKKVGKSFNVRDSKAKLIEILEG